jgi:hypothetical protein
MITTILLPATLTGSTAALRLIMEYGEKIMLSIVEIIYHKGMTG